MSVLARRPEALTEVGNSNSYLLSGELATKLTGRYVETEMFALGFSEYLGMKSFLGMEPMTDAQEFEQWLAFGGFPRALRINEGVAKDAYVRDVIGTLRTLSVLVALFTGTGGVLSPVGVEEPEIALHPAAAGILLDAIRDASEHRQVLLTTRSRCRSGRAVYRPIA